jgi:hypothetical protein
MEQRMKLWLISQSVNTGYDTYDGAVVAAETEEAARLTHPSTYPDSGWPKRLDPYPVWSLLQDVTVELIGEALDGTKPGVICASFNAG